MVKDMQMIVNDVQLHYEDYGDGKKETLVFLHGWGQNISMMKPLAEPFQKENRIIIFDLPGHGESSEPTYPWQVEDYVSCIYECLKQLKVQNPVLIGHSFGGKISLLYASKYPVKKLILFGSPYTKEIQKESLKLKVLKSLKKVPVINKLEGFAKKHIGSTDYRNASKMMREILVNTVNLDITEEVKKITSPTILIWGTLDEAVPLKRAYELESLLKDSAVIEYEGCSHYAYLERLNQSIQIIRNFIGQ